MIAMNNMVDIDVIIDENYIEPKVNILTKSKTKQVESIINSIENTQENEYPYLTGYIDGKAELISQRDIVRVYIENRKIIIETAEKLYYTKKNLTMLESILNPSRFVRISQSEIINLYKVIHFEFNIAGTIGVKMENSKKTWVARSRVKSIKNIINNGK